MNYDWWWNVMFISCSYMNKVSMNRVFVWLLVLFGIPLQGSKCWSGHVQLKCVQKGKIKISSFPCVIELQFTINSTRWMTWHRSLFQWFVHHSISHEFIYILFNENQCFTQVKCANKQKGKGRGKKYAKWNRFYHSRVTNTVTVMSQCSCLLSICDNMFDLFYFNSICDMLVTDITCIWIEANRKREEN